MEKAVWFSRHPMTASQAEEIAAAGYEIYNDPKITEFSTRNLTKEKDIMTITIHFQVLRDVLGVRRFYGVFPPIIRAVLLAWREERFGNPIELWESWNIQRSPEGGKPTFEHKRFVLTFKG